MVGYVGYIRKTQWNDKIDNLKNLKFDKSLIHSRAAYGNGNILAKTCLESGALIFTLMVHILLMKIIDFYGNMYSILTLP